MDRTVGLTADFKSQELRKKLLDCLNRENTQFSAIANQLIEKGHHSDADKIQLLQAIIETVDRVLAAGDWESSLFLKNTAKPLKAIKAEAETELADRQGRTTQKHIKIAPLSEDEQEVYVSLFQSDGYNKGKWAVQLRALSRYVVGRPIYQHEADIQKRIRLRAASENEAYVIVAVKKKDVLSDPFQTNVLKDQYDHPLVQLKETAVQNGRIISFVHNKVRYHFVDGRLSKEDDS